MTTIAYRDGVIAADTRETENGLIYPVLSKKIVKLPDGSLFGASGDAEECETLLETAQRRRAPPELKECNGLHIKTDGSVWFFEQTRWVKIDAPYIAIGSGRVPAMVAMRLGADPAKAVNIAMEFDAHTGGSIMVEKLTPKRKKKR
jgi:ATP-dependent HslUV protease subunit HslV